MLPIGVVFTWYAWRTRDWGSVVAAHAIFDLAALFGRTHAA